MNEKEDREKGQALLNAVERILDDPGDIIALVDRMERAACREHEHADGWFVKDLVGKRLINHYANRAALSGGVTALPGLIPGLGSFLAITGGALVDMALTLKFEVEMAQALAWNFGFDIREPAERELAFLLAAVNTHDVSSGGTFLEDVAAAEGVAIWNYAPRQVPKLLVQVAGRLALRGATKGLTKALPLVGVAIGGTVNRTLTAGVGERCMQELKERKVKEEAQTPQDDVVDAVVVDRKEEP